MTPAEAAILQALFDARTGRQGTRAWLRPMDFGGHNNSHHGRTATRMVAKGWVQREKRWISLSRGPRGSFHYRITASGAQALAKHCLVIDPAGDAKGAPRPTVTASWVM